MVIPRGELDQGLAAVGLYLPAELSDDKEAIAAFQCLRAKCAAACAAKRQAEAEAAAAARQAVAAEQLGHNVDSDGDATLAGAVTVAQANLEQLAMQAMQAVAPGAAGSGEREGDAQSPEAAAAAAAAMQARQDEAKKLVSGVVSTYMGRGQGGHSPSGGAVWVAAGGR